MLSSILLKFCFVYLPVLIFVCVVDFDILRLCLLMFLAHCPPRPRLCVASLRVSSVVPFCF